MKGLPFVCLLFLACGGSSGGEQTGQQKASLSCDTITPDADVCAFGFEASKARSVDSVLVTAKIARDARADTETACLAGLSDLGRTDVSAAESCDALVLAIRTTIPRLTIDIAEPTCSDAPPAACLGSAAPRRERCAEPAVTVVASEDATAFEQTVARVVRERFGPIARAKRDMDRFTDLVGNVSAQIGDAPAECAPAMVRMVNAAMDDAKQAALQSRATLAAVTDRP